MTSLTILRHAKSSWDQPMVRDYDRKINARGAAGAALVGQHWRALNRAAPVQILASPAVRVAETLAIFLPAAGLDHLAIGWDRRLYLASSVTIMDVVRDMADPGAHVLVAGHNPGLEDLVLTMVPDASDDPDEQARRAAVEQKLPTATLAELNFAGDIWRDAAAPARLSLLIRPRDLDPALGPGPDG